MDYFVLAWNNVSHPIVKLQNGAEHADCYNDLSFLRSALCADFNVRFIESKVVGIGIRVISEAMAGDYIFYAYYLGAKHNLSLVQISVYLKGNAFLLVRFHLESVSWYLFRFKTYSGDLVMTFAARGPYAVGLEKTLSELSHCLSSPRSID